MEALKCFIKSESYGEKELTIWPHGEKNNIKLIFVWGPDQYMGGKESIW